MKSTIVKELLEWIDSKVKQRETHKMYSESDVKKLISIAEVETELKYKEDTEKEKILEEKVKNFKSKYSKGYYDSYFEEEEKKRKK